MTVVTEVTSNGVTAVTETPEQRAALAAEELAAGGAAVTARSVRARSGVMMAVAAKAARAWNDGQAATADVPPMPVVLEARTAALWRDAVLAARAEFEQARTGWQVKLDALEAECEGLADEADRARIEADARADRLVAELDQARADVVRHTEAAAAANERADDERSRADRADARAEAIVAERDRLVAELDQARADATAASDLLAATSREVAAAVKRADRAEAKLEILEPKA